MIQVWLRPGTQKAVASGHPWVYRNQIDPEAGDLASMPSTEPGSLVTVHDSRGRYLGSGFYNPRSMITVRLLTHRREMPDDSLIVRRIEEAWPFARLTGARIPTATGWFLLRRIACRPDRRPVRRYVVLQVLALGMERWQETAAACLVAKLRPARLILKNDDPIRLKEGLELYQRAYYGDLTAR
jgi:23S rRNA (cytosine1962-C5)-methyltransferase